MKFDFNFNRFKKSILAAFIFVNFKFFVCSPKLWLLVACGAVAMIQCAPSGENRPYEFGFNIGTQHREEKKGSFFPHFISLFSPFGSFSDRRVLYRHSLRCLVKINHLHLQDKVSLRTQTIGNVDQKFLI